MTNASLIFCLLNDAFNTQIIWHRMPEWQRTDGSNEEYTGRGPVSGNIPIYSRWNWGKPRKHAKQPLAKLWFKAENFCIQVGTSVRNAGLKRELSEDSLAHGKSIITRDCLPGSSHRSMSQGNVGTSVYAMNWSFTSHEIPQTTFQEIIN